MRKLAVAVAVLAFLAVIAGAHKDDTETLLLAAGALLCAYTTWRSSEISSFLKIFVGIFTTETIVFGVLNLIEVEGHWPAALQDYSLPETMALTVAVFSILVYLVSRSPIVREMTRIADLYFDSDAASEMRIWPFPAFRASEPLIAVITIVVLVLFNQGIVGISVAITFIRRDYYNALQEMNASVFWAKLLFGFTPLAFIYIATAVTEYVIKSYLILRWRRWLTKHYVDRWLGGHRHYAMALTGTAADNPDQRIAEDVNRFIDGGEEGYGIYSFTILLISTLSSVVSYSILLWSISAELAFPIAKGVVLPGWLFWVALIYALGGTLATHWIGRPLTGLMFKRQRREADFRFSLARMREYGEQVALLSGETTERASLGKRFGAIVTNYLDIIGLRKRLVTFTATYHQLSGIFPLAVVAPFMLIGQIKFGVVRQTLDAFAEVEGALNFIVNYYTYLADYRSVLDRLATFDAATERADELMSRPAAQPTEKADIALDLALMLPDGRRIVDARGIRLAKGESVLLSGPSGSGKSTLFRAIAGIWPYFEGAIGTPKGASLMLLPQRPYIPIGSLRAALTYPNEASAYSSDEIKSALSAAKLSQFQGQLDEQSNWAQRLSGGEQQRVAIARALLAKPNWLFLDEATSALDETLEADIYGALKQRLPNTSIVSIGHRDTLSAYHKRRFAMEPGADGLFTPRERVSA